MEVSDIRTNVQTMVDRATNHAIMARESACAAKNEESARELMIENRIQRALVFQANEFLDLLARL